MKTKDINDKGNLNENSKQTIYLNVNNLKKGIYILNIVDNDKIIKKTTFKKT
ncbi:hypothetical protein [Urechidicola croceus]|uniref:hypothetical protein n=1 Tax=Urechidicola croceus TaxID=1850246 RepID=UPI0012EA3744|nr:hypothetical protein [Urechidicola croceus]